MRALPIFLTLLCSCMEFRISEEEAVAQFEHDSPNFTSVDIEGRTVHFVHTDQGNDTLVAFVHGSPGSWNAFIEYFKEDSLTSRFDVVSLDRMGYGESDFGVPEPSLEVQARLLDGALSTFDHSYKILVGHSLGGPICARMGMDFPNEYEKLVLVAPSIDPAFEVDGKLRTWFRTPIPRIITPKEFWVSNEEIIPAKEELEKMTALWGQIKARVLVVQGTDDSLVPKENADYAQKMLPDSILEVRLLDGVDHFIPWSHPEEIVRAILD